MIEAIQCALGQPTVLAELRALLASAEAEIVAMGLTCEGCGHCCDFAAAGHRLYASTAEIALAVSESPVAPAELLRCGYQVDGLCRVRDARPLGCRMYFCGPDEERFAAVYERAHGAIRALHTQANVPYFYAEFTASLRAYAQAVSI